MRKLLYFDLLLSYTRSHPNLFCETSSRGWASFFNFLLASYVVFQQYRKISYVFLEQHLI